MSTDRQQEIVAALVGSKHAAAYRDSLTFSTAIHQLAAMIELWVDGIADKPETRDEAVDLQSKIMEHMSYGPAVHDVVNALNTGKAETDRTP